MCSNARADRVCSEEYQSWCRVNHPLCTIYKEMCDPVQDVFEKFKYKEKMPFNLAAIEDSEELILKNSGCPRNTINEISNKSFSITQNFQVCSQNNLDYNLSKIPVTGLSPKIATNGNSFLATWYNLNDTDDSPNFAFLAKRISSCGNVIDSDSIVIREPYINNSYYPNPDYEIASDGSGYMIVEARVDDKYQIVIYIVTQSGEVIFKNEGKELASGYADIYRYPKINYSNGFYYVVGYSWQPFPPPSGSLGLTAWKIDNEGNIIDNKFICDPLGFCNFWPIVDLTFDGENFVVFGQTNPLDPNIGVNEVYSIKFDQNLNIVTQPTKIHEINEISYVSKALFSQDAYAIAYHYLSPTGWMAKFLRINANTLDKCLSDDIPSDTFPDLYLLNSKFLIDYSYQGNLYGRFADINCLLTNEKSIADTSDDEINSLSAIAYNGNKLFVPWDSMPDPVTHYIFTEAFDENVNKLYKLLISKAPYLHRYSDIVYANSEYLTAWNDFRSGKSEIYGSKLNDNGLPKGEPFLLQTGSNPQVLPKLAYNGTKYAMVYYDLSVPSVLKTKFIDENKDFAIAVISDVYLYSHDIAGFPNGFAIAYIKDGNVTARFLYNNGTLSNEMIISTYPYAQLHVSLAWNSIRNEFFVIWSDAAIDGWNIYGARFNDSGIIATNIVITIDESWKFFPSIAMSNQGYLVSENDYISWDLNSYLIDFDGNVKDPPGRIPICHNSLGCSSYTSDAAFDGQHYFLLWNALNSAFPIKGTLIDPEDGNVHDPGGIALGQSERFRPAVDTDGNSFIFSYISYLNEPFVIYRTVENSYEKLMIEAVEPFAGCSSIGANVKIKGRGFKDGAIAYFNGTLVNIVYEDCHTLDATVPPMAASYYNVKVINPDGEIFELANAYRSVSNATIAGIDINTGCETGGTTVNLQGTNIINGVTRVFVNGIEAQVLSYNPPSQLQFKMPPHTAGQANVTIANANCTPAASTVSFKYVAVPKVLATTVKSGLNTGATDTEILGELFDETVRVFFKAEVNNQVIESDAVNFSLENSYRIAARTAQFGTPPVAAVATICVQDSDCSPACMPEGFGFYESGHYAVSPHIGTVAGWTTVYIYGANLNEVQDIYIGDVQAIKAYQDIDMLAAITRPRSSGIVDIILTKLSGSDTIPSIYKYATLGYVIGEGSYVEIIDTDDDVLVDLNPYEPGRQSQAALINPVKKGSFSIAAYKTPFEVDGRYAFFADTQRILKMDTGSNSMVSSSPVIFPPPLPTGFYNDVATAFMRLGVKGANVLVIAANYIVADQCGLQGGIITMDSNTLKVIDSKIIPELADGSTINISMDENKAFITALEGYDGLPYTQIIAEADINIDTGVIDSVVLHRYPYTITSFDNFYNIGSDVLSQVCMLQGFYQCAYFVAPEANEVDVISKNPNCPCPKPNVSAYLSYPQDIAVGNVYDPIYNVYDWKGFVVNAANNTWERINNLLTSPTPEPNALPTGGTTPVACEIQRSDDLALSYKKVYIVHANSVDNPDPGLDESDVTVVRSYADNIKNMIKGIAQDFHSKSIAIQKVLSSTNFLEADKSTIEVMPDSDFTTPSKRQVLLNKLDVIDHLLKTHANKQAIISNTNNFEKQVEKFVVNQAKKEELIAFAQSIIKSVE